MAKGSVFYIFFAVILLLGVFLRFYDLTERPIHHDEGVIGWFRLNIYNGCTSANALSRLLNGGSYASACGASYSYDPEYHGPFPLLLGAWAFTFFGISDYILRAPGCLFNALTIALLLFLRKDLSDAGTLIAAALLAVSPSMVYYSQFAYSDDYLIFFTLAAVVLASKYLHERRDVFLYLLSADVATLFAIKESSFLFLLSAASFASALLFAHLLKKRAEHKRPVLSNLRIRPVIYSALIFALVYSFFYSNMFTNPSGILKGINGGVSFWLNRGSTWSAHFKPFEYYFNLLLRYEPAVLLGSLMALFSQKKAFSRWCAWWAGTTLLIYSIMPYKTPWLSINLVLPLAILSGTGAGYCSTKLAGWKRYLFAAVFLLLIAYSLNTAWDATYVHYVDAGNDLSYVNNLRDYNVMLSEIEKKSGIFGMNATNISIVLSDPWPLPWSLRDYRLLYSKIELTTPIIISDKSDYSYIPKDRRFEYEEPKKFEMRQGTYIYVYFQKDNFSATRSSQVI